MDELATTDVIETAPVLDASTEAVSAPADGEGSTPPADAAAPTPEEQSDGQAEAAFKVPENDDDLKGHENDPQVVPIIQMRRELRERDQRLDSYKPLEAWKEVASTIGDPSLAQSAHELVSAIHTADPANPSGFTSRPFLEQLEQTSPGTVDQLFADTLGFQVPDEQGKPSTVVRELVKSWGLDPDRIEDYRNIDTLRASGVVTAEDISKIPEKYHAAFKSLSAATREDLLAMQDANPTAMDEYLRNAADALDARTFREKQTQAAQAQADQERTAFEQQVQQTVSADLFGRVRTAFYDPIHQNLSSQFKFSADETVNTVENAKIMATLATLQNPAYRFVAEDALKAVGVTLNGFDDLANRWESERAKYIELKAMGQEQSWPARQAKSQADLAEQQIAVKLNDYAHRLAQQTGERFAAAASAQTNQLATATARYVPAGAGQAQQGDTNPYSANPHPIGSQEYFAFNKRLDREYNLTGASVFER